MSGPGTSPDGDRRAAGRAVAVAAGGVLAASLYLAATGVAPFETWAYHASWYPLLLALDGAYAWRTGRFALLGRRRFAASLFLWSAPLWFVFEVLNVRLANWFYVGVPESPALRWAGYVTAFATVLPAVYLPDRWLGLWLRDGDLRGPEIPVGALGRRLSAAAGVLFVALAMWRPEWFYPLVWGALALLLEPWNHARDPERSLLGDLERGRYGRIVRLLLAGLTAGLLWESMNALAGTRWIYTVPGLEQVKLFEMPPPGFLGFTVFGLECWAAYRALVNAGVAVGGWEGAPARSRRGDAGFAGPGARPLRAGAALVAAGLFCLAASLGVDRWTAASHRSGLEALPGVGAETAAAIRSAGFAGAGALARADSALLADAAGLPPGRAGELVRAARLAELRGLGPRNAALLLRGGVEDVCALASAGEERIARLLADRGGGGRAGYPPRVRVWLRAARDACGAEERRGRPRRRPAPG